MCGVHGQCEHKSASAHQLAIVKVLGCQAPPVGFDDGAAQAQADAQAVGRRIGAAREAFLEVVDFIAANTRSNPNAAFAGSVPYLMLAGNLVAGWQMGRALLVALTPEAQAQDAAFMAAKITTARFYGDHILSKVPGMRDSIVQGAGSVTALPLEAF